MIDPALFRSVAMQLMTGDKLEVRGEILAVRRTSSKRLKSVRFTAGGREYEAIEQNPDKPSQWGQLAREGHQVVQFKDVATNRFVAVAVDGDVKVYGKRSSGA